MASVRIYQKKEVRLDRLNVRQTQMFKIANVGVSTVKNRLAAAQGPNDGPAKPLSRYYAIRKTKMGKGNRRNLMLTGELFDPGKLRGNLTADIRAKSLGDNWWLSAGMYGLFQQNAFGLGLTYRP